MRAAFLLPAFIGALLPTLTLAQPAVVLPNDELVAGATQEEWSRRWWQWAMSFSNERSPVADRTGANCSNGQAGSVWFLAGTYGTRRTERTCRVPQGRTLFFPLINYVTYPSAGSSENCLSLMSRAARLTQSPSALVLEINGVRIEDLESHRIATKGCFQLAGNDSPLGAGNGYYVAVAPLPPGVHVLNFGGILPGMSQAVTYTLVVE